MNNYCPSDDWERWVDMTTDELEEMVEEALYADGRHHKQWYLIKIAKMLNYKFDWKEIEAGIEP